MTLDLRLVNPRNPREWVILDSSPAAYAAWLVTDKASDPQWIQDEKEKRRSAVKAAGVRAAPRATAAVPARQKTRPPSPARLDPRGLNLEWARAEVAEVSTWLDQAKSAPGVLTEDHIEQREQAEAYMCDLYRFWGCEL